MLTPSTPFQPLPIGNRNYDIGNILFREISAGSLYLPDVMFLIGGLLSSVMWYPVFAKTKGKLSFFSYVALRWFRITPVIIAILLIGFVYPRFGSGPFFQDLASHMQTNCRTNFWKNLLYIANFERGLNMVRQFNYISTSFLSIFQVQVQPFNLCLSSPVPACDLVPECRLPTLHSSLFDHLLLV